MGTKRTEIQGVKQQEKNGLGQFSLIQIDDLLNFSLCIFATLYYEKISY